MSVSNSVPPIVERIGDRHPNGTAVAIGKFEGVHRGHQQIIEQLQAVAEAKQLATVALTFRNNPLSVLAPERCPRPVMSPAQRLESLKATGLDDVLMLPFDAELASLSPGEFIDRYLVEALGAKHVIVGDDFRFGAGAAGDSQTLREYGPSRGFTVEAIDEVSDERLGRVSSSRIREMLGDGDVAGAARLLGAPHRVRGSVVRGDARGRDLGFPTANLGPTPGQATVEGFVPRDGVYAGFALVGGVRHEAAISVGNNPSFTPEGISRVEAYLLDFSADIYGETIEVDFVERLRGMETYENIDALIAQMREDVADTRRALTKAQSNRLE